MCGYCDVHGGAVDSLIFAGCCITREALRGIARLNPEGDVGKHRTVSTVIEDRGGYALVHIDWWSSRA
jgi:hypothetical protein